MKKLFFLFAILASVAASAQSTVQITPVSATYTTTPTIQFKVSWTNQSTDNHRNKVWIFVDFQPVISPTQKGNWQPATITGTVQKTAGTVSEQSNRGFFLEGTATNFSATVTVQLSNTGAQFNWCAYASDCPPNIGDYNNGTYTLRGTPPFTLKDASGVTQPVPDKTIAQSALTITPVTMTDATGCPGYFCKYIGRDLYIDATHLCQQRTSGAQNWEAWIKDTRDAELYRIVFMPDNKWWLAQNVKYAKVGSAISGCTKDECGRCYTWAQAYASYDSDTYGSSGTVQGICPFGWLLPVSSNYEAIISAIGSIANTLAALRSLNATCTPIHDTYGFATVKEVCDGSSTRGTMCWYTNDTNRDNGCVLDWNSATDKKYCGKMFVNLGHGGNTAHIRCFRQL
ncbi:MAG: hypothetical protein LBG31_06220 [Prevotellaceae bacterium]|jgi:uncharacterized protein (TIGR02145 family)|nr:hypothetical protein [Prevotellaceae bacterium]